MNSKKILIEKLKGRVLSSLKENTNVKDGPGDEWLYDPYFKNTKIKTGEKWFYEPFNSCLKNLIRKDPNNFKLDGHTLCYTKKINGEKGCFEARWSQNDKGVWHATPGHIVKYIEDRKKEQPEFNPSLFDLNRFDMYGDWWCEPGKNEPILDWLQKTKAHQERMANKEENLKKSINQDWDNWTKEEIEKQKLKKQSLRNITQAKTMEDVKNGVGYIIKGMRGPVVKELQKMLLALKYNLGTSKDDSIFGAATEDAVEKFQKDTNIKPKNDIYGIFGKITYEKMMKKLNELK